MTTKSTILIIDDDKDLVNTLRIVLEKNGYQVRTAYDGKEGYRHIRQEKPGLIILDVMMTSDTEGFDLAYKLKADPDHQNIPILMLTSFIGKMDEIGTDKFQHIMGEEWPVSQLVEKPVDPGQLLSIVKALLKQREDS